MFKRFIRAEHENVPSTTILSHLTTTPEADDLTRFLCILLDIFEDII